MPSPPPPCNVHINNDYPAIGIDYGTTTATVCIFHNGMLETFVDSHGSPATPTCVAMPNHLDPHAPSAVITEVAQTELLMNYPDNVATSVKRLIGSRYSSSFVQDLLHTKQLPYAITADKSNHKDHPRVRLGSPPFNYDPSDLALPIFNSLVHAAKTKLGISEDGPVVSLNCVLTVPVEFNAEQVEALCCVAKRAHLNVLTTIFEPVAASLARHHSKLIEKQQYSHTAHQFDVHKAKKQEQEQGQEEEEEKYDTPGACNDDTNLTTDDNINDTYNNTTDDTTQQYQLIFDLGGGTLDLSVTRRGASGIDVLSTCGDRCVGGDDFTKVIYDWAYPDDESTPTSSRDKCPQLAQAELAKLTLSSPDIHLATLSTTSKTIDLTRAQFQHLSKPLVDRIMAKVSDVVANANLCSQDIHEVVLVGGGCSLFNVSTAVQNAFPHALIVKQSPTLLVAQGAALYAAVLSQHPSQDMGLDKHEYAISTHNHNNNNPPQHPAVVTWPIIVHQFLTLLSLTVFTPCIAWFHSIYQSFLSMVLKACAILYFICITTPIKCVLFAQNCIAQNAPLLIAILFLAVFALSWQCYLLSERLEMCT